MSALRTTIGTKQIAARYLVQGRLSGIKSLMLCDYGQQHFTLRGQLLQKMPW